jgi:myosin heavy subunit
VGVLKSINVTDAMIASLFQTLSGLLHLGNIGLGENANGDSYVTSSNELKLVSKLLMTHEALLQQGLCSRTMRLKGSEMQIPLKPDEARSSRDALAKAIYGKLFGWIIAQVNGSLMDANARAQEAGFLGILDIYGFENFDRNSLEQLFINFANEQLHQHFAISLFKTEQEIYAREGIVWPGVEWEDNTECLELIAGKSPKSVFNSLAEHSRLPKSNDSEMTEKILSDNRKCKYITAPKMSSGTRTGGKSSKLTAKEAFVITHFAGDVLYRTEGWLRKNTDTLHEDLQVCMSSSSSPLLAQLFSVGTINAITGGQKGGGKRAGYVAEKYARQLEDLMRTLRASNSHFVRCIKPNHQQEPHRFVADLVLGQLRNSGMVDAVRLLSAGYCTRVTFESLEKQFKPMCPAKFQRLPPAMFCVGLLTAFDLGRADFLLGLTKAFFKSGKLAFVDSLLSGSRSLDDAFFAKMGRMLTLWRFRRAVSAVRCLIYMNAKMRRLRALWKFRRSANIAAMIGSSWVRRAKEIRYGTAIDIMQAHGRGFVARKQRDRRKNALLLLQRMSRGYLGRIERDRVKVEREKERKRKAKEERERKIRDRREAMEAKEREEKAAREAADGERRAKMKNAAARFGGSDKLTRGAAAAASAALPEEKPAKQMNFKKKGSKDKIGDEVGDDDGVVDASDERHIAPGDGDESEGSDLMVPDSDDEMGPIDGEDIEGDGDGGDDSGDGTVAGIHNPRQLLAATAALDVRSERRSQTGMAIPNLNLGDVDSDDPLPGDSGSMSARRRTPSLLSRMKNNAMVPFVSCYLRLGLPCMHV